MNPFEEKPRDFWPPAGTPFPPSSTNRFDFPLSVTLDTVQMCACPSCRAPVDNKWLLNTKTEPKYEMAGYLSDDSFYADRDHTNSNFSDSYGGGGGLFGDPFGDSDSDDLFGTGGLGQCDCAICVAHREREARERN